MAQCPYCGSDPGARVVGRWEVFLPVEPPSQNDLSAANKGRYKQRKSYRSFRDGYSYMLQAWRVRELIPLPSGRRRVVLTRHYSGQGKRRDKGNLIGGMKGLLDALVIARLLADDTERDVEDHYGQERVDGEAGVHILLEELAP